MSGFRLGIRSRMNLKGVHPDLVAVVKRALELGVLDFTVTEGLRTLERQKKLKLAGASWTLNSRHLTGHAVDLAVLVNGKVRWDWPLYEKLAKVMRLAAYQLKIPIECGIDWKQKDGPHFQLPRKEYP